MLEKYNKRKRKFSNLPKPAFEDSPHVKCKKCPDVMFDSSQLLIAHYSTFHSSDCKLDFIVLSQGSKKKSTGLYKCAHCRKQLNGIKKLHHHLDHHRAMNVKAAETKESLVITTTPEATSTEVSWDCPCNHLHFCSFATCLNDTCKFESWWPLLCLTFRCVGKMNCLCSKPWGSWLNGMWHQWRPSLCQQVLCRHLRNSLI